jgi:hypothetical protein
MPHTNAAAHALDTYAAKRGLFEEYASKQVMVTDLIADLLHLLDEHKGKPHEAQPLVAHSSALERFVEQTHSR